MLSFPTICSMPLDSAGLRNSRAAIQVVAPLDQVVAVLVTQAGLGTSTLSKLKVQHRDGEFPLAVEVVVELPFAGAAGGEHVVQ
jgi:hypothetical protein